MRKLFELSDMIRRSVLSCFLCYVYTREELYYESIIIILVVCFMWTRIQCSESL